MVKDEIEKKYSIYKKKRQKKIRIKFDIKTISKPLCYFR